MNRNEVIVAGAVLSLIVYTFALSLVGQVLSSPQTSKKISNSGVVKTVGVGVYWDCECNDLASSIDWGTTEPGSSENVTCYIRNEGNLASAISFDTSNWNPAEASRHITLNWDYDGQPFNPDEVTEVTFKLLVSKSVKGITSFSFDIRIVGGI